MDCSIAKASDGLGLQLNCGFVLPANLRLIQALNQKLTGAATR